MGDAEPIRVDCRVQPIAYPTIRKDEALVALASEVTQRCYETIQRVVQRAPQPMFRFEYAQTVTSDDVWRALTVLLTNQGIVFAKFGAPTTPPRVRLERMWDGVTYGADVVLAIPLWEVDACGAAYRVHPYDRVAQLITADYFERSVRDAADVRAALRRADGAGALVMPAPDLGPGTRL